VYNVVFRTIAVCSSRGAITWVSFKDKKYFNEWYDEKMRGWYEVVDQGVSRECAIELCSTPEAKIAVAAYGLKKLNKLLR